MKSSKEQETTMAILAYIGPLVIVSYIQAKDNPFVKFHIKQGLVLFAIEILIWLLGTTLWQFWMFLNLVNLGVFVLAVLGIVNVTNKKQEPLPLVGDFAKYFTF